MDNGTELLSWHRDAIVKTLDSVKLLRTVWELAALCHFHKWTFVVFLYSVERAPEEEVSFVGR